MKKIFFSAALAAMMMASCQNENLVNSNEIQEVFTVEVTKGMDSRVYMDGSVAKWSADDALYVYGTNGVRGTLYLTSGANSKTATFTGVISGSSKNLTNAIFGNVTHNGDAISLTLSNVDASQCDAPMFGAFSSDKGSINLDYICGLVPVQIKEDGNGNLSDVKLGGYGVSTLSLVDGEWVPGTAYADITLTNVPDGQTFYVPFFTTTEENAVKTPLTIKVGDDATYTFAPETKSGALSTTESPVLTYDETNGLNPASGSDSKPSMHNVSNSEQLAQAISDKKTDIVLAPGEYEVDLYVLEKREVLNLIGTKGTKVTFMKSQVRMPNFRKFSIENCEIMRMPGKSWGMLVFGSGDKADGIYTVSNCTFNGVGTQGIYINETVTGAVYNILDCTFNGDFGGEGAVTIQGNPDVKHIVNVSDCVFNNIPATSHKICVVPNTAGKTYIGWTLNTDVDTKDVYWMGEKVE